MAILQSEGQNLNRGAAVDTQEGPADNRVISVDNTVNPGFFQGIGQNKNSGTGDILG